MSRRGARTERNAATNEEGNRAAEANVAPDLRTMLTKALRVALSAQGGGVRTGVDESVGPMNAPRIDFAKVNRDYASLGGRSFDGTESVIQVQEWIDTCDKIYDNLELKDA